MHPSFKSSFGVPLIPLLLFPPHDSLQVLAVTSGAYIRSLVARQDLLVTGNVIRNDFPMFPLEDGNDEDDKDKGSEEALIVPSLTG